MKKIKINESQYRYIIESSIAFDSKLPEYQGSTVTNGKIATDSDDELESKKNVTSDDVAWDISKTKPDCLGSWGIGRH